METIRWTRAASITRRSPSANPTTSALTSSAAAASPAAPSTKVKIDNQAACSAMLAPFLSLTNPFTFGQTSRSPPPPRASAISMELATRRGKRSTAGVNTGADPAIRSQSRVNGKPDLETRADRGRALHTDQLRYQIAVDLRGEEPPTLSVRLASRGRSRAAVHPTA